MRYLVFASCLFIYSSCQTVKSIKTKEPVAIETYSNTEDSSFTYGKVTHLINTNQCVCITVFNKKSNPSIELILLPKDPLPYNLNKEGTEIKFHYHTLKIKNPEGCLKGMPAVLTEITNR